MILWWRDYIEQDLIVGIAVPAGLCFWLESKS
jgi:hypothetical protein